MFDISISPKDASMLQPIYRFFGNAVMCKIERKLFTHNIIPYILDH